MTQFPALETKVMCSFDSPSMEQTALPTVGQICLVLHLLHFFKEKLITFTYCGYQSQQSL